MKTRKAGIAKEESRGSWIAFFWGDRRNLNILLSLGDNHYQARG